jgi:(E)-4-hydroxy-3-methylbut-2-enyl-diphosphate synthase
MAVAAYRKLAALIEQPLHLGITEAGGFRSGAVKSAIGLGMLLAEGIGAIRVSLAADPVEGSAWVGTSALHVREVSIIACPSCSRQEFNVIATVNAWSSVSKDIRSRSMGRHRLLRKRSVKPGASRSGGRRSEPALYQRQA